MKRRPTDPCDPRSKKLKAARAWLASRGITEVKAVHASAAPVLVALPPARRRLSSV
jgi:hypothetical protein